MDAGHGVHAGPLRGPKVNSLGRAAERGQGRVVTDASGHVVTCPFARSCGDGGSLSRGDLRITTGNELWSSAGARESPADDAAASMLI